MLRHITLSKLYKLLCVFSLLVLASCSPSPDESVSGADESMTQIQHITLLDPHAQQKFVNDLPIPLRIDATGGGDYDLPIGQGEAWMGLVGENNQQLMTTMWGFEWQGEVHSPGPTILAQENTPIRVRWDNELPYGSHLFPVDTSIHMARVEESGELPLVIHLHGGHSDADSDGNPLAWYTQAYQEQGPVFTQEVYTYDNTQEASTIWYHDHTLGMTRLNVYAGIAGFYLVTDDNERELLTQGRLPDDDDTVELLVADKLFSDDGQLYYPGHRSQPTSMGHEIEDDAPEPSHIDEFWGNFIVVNGMVWPKHDVNPQVNRFRLLNGSDTRSYVFKFDEDVTFYQIGSDGGFLDNPVALEEIVLGPAERADILVDFSAYAGQSLVLRNVGPDVPFKGFVDADAPGETALVYNPNGERVLSDGRGGITTVTDAETTGQIMRFDVADTAPMMAASNDTEVPNAIGDLALSVDTPLRTPLERLIVDDANVRQLALFRLDDPDSRNLLLLGTLDDGSLFYDDPVTEVIEEGAIEIWEIYNATVSAHPIHLHLVQFEILDRQPFDGELINKPQMMGHSDEMINGAALRVDGLTAERVLPQPNEWGPKDTVIVPPGQVTRVIARFDKVGGYVWHCHLLSHEDFDMMRPFDVVNTVSPTNEG